ncbi:MAG: hypothetical protein Q4D81_00815 [Eubacteriales bacterium]|nr:hypothetical protein [Eubacteriales bacterium]
MRKGLEYKRFIWEEILPEPAVFRVCEAGSGKNAYFIVSGGESLAVDPQSEEMVRSIERLSGGLGAPPEKMQIFLTQGCRDADMEKMIESLRSESVVYTGASGEPERTVGTGGPARMTVVSDGNKICIGRRFFQCIRLEGHARGLTGLWLPEEGVLFSGEAVGCDYLPDVPAWDDRIDTLGLQVETLRRIGNLPVRLILPGQGMPAGLETYGDKDDSRISSACASVLENMLRQYCVHILETYQQIPARGSIAPEQLEKAGRGKAGNKIGSEAGSGEEARRDIQAAEKERNPGTGDMAASCRKFLLYRKYIRQKEDEEGRIIFERGSMYLTDWSLRED